MKIAIIPARGGSKRIPRKNIKTFCGRPMISWPISTAIKSGIFDRIIVSTDDSEIADIANEAGAETPFTRPPELSDDHTATRPVIQHAIRFVENESGKDVDFACGIYATAAFVQPADLQAGHEACNHPDVLFSFAASSYPHPIQRALRLDESGHVEMANPEFAKTRTQDLQEHFHDSGMFYWGKREAFLSDLPMFAPHSRIVEIPRERAFDIDTQEDWDFAELAFEVSRRRKI